MTTTWAIESLVRGSLVLAAALCVCAALRRHSAALRHAILAAAILGSALVPARELLPEIAVPLPAVSTPSQAPAATIGVTSISEQLHAVPQARGAAGARWLAVWLAGAMVMTILLAADAIRMRRIARRATLLEDERWRRCAERLRQAFGIRTAVPLLLTTTPDTLATSGVLRPRVMLPLSARHWSDERIRVVLSHEFAHISRQDWVVQIGAEMVRALTWFNPLAWIACTRLRRESEHACDDIVVARGVAAPDYAAHLVAIARSCRRPAQHSSVMAMARPSTLHRRITVMLNSDVDHRTQAPRRMVWIGTLAFTLLVSVIALQARQTGPAPLSGTVYDPTGAVLPGVAITLRDANGIDKTATTDAAGRFEFAAIPPGQYRFTTSRPGFKAVDTNLDLRNTGDWDRAITMQVGDLHETITVSQSRMGPVQPVQPGTAQPLRVGGNIRPPLKLVDVRPVYPPEMQASGREGVVPLEAIIRRDGTVGSVRVLSAQVHPDFAIAAADAVRQWRFSPTLLNGQAVEVVMNVSVTFRLSD
ncbi:MAG TPA: M56 family metallopeptidase [Vicinamibacterales bacterium]|nr:M56 family metallopeptidase [Vicinamibacterales bacterium]